MITPCIYPLDYCDSVLSVNTLHQPESILVTKKERLLIYLQPETKQKLQELAIADQRSLSIYVERVLVKHIEEIESQGS